MRVVLDTNVWVSGLLWRGTPHRLLEALERRHIPIAVTAPLLDELRTVLQEAKFLPRLHQVRLTPDDILTVVLERTQLFPDRAVAGMPHVVEDPTDDRVLRCALISRAALLITGDRHLLRLHQSGQSGTLTIVTPSSALARLAHR